MVQIIELHCECKQIRDSLDTLVIPRWDKSFFFPDNLVVAHLNFMNPAQIFGTRLCV